jgi:hypothetical protein
MWPAGTLRLLHRAEDLAGVAIVLVILASALSAVHVDPHEHRSHAGE